MTSKQQITFLRCSLPTDLPGSHHSRDFFTITVARWTTAPLHTIISCMSVYFRPSDLELSVSYLQDKWKEWNGGNLSSWRGILEAYGSGNLLTADSIKGPLHESLIHFLSILPHHDRLNDDLKQLWKCNRFPLPLFILVKGNEWLKLSTTVKLYF